MWQKYFALRHSEEISIVKCELGEYGRTIVEEADIRKYLDELYEHVEGDPACGETHVPMLVIAKKPDKKALLQKDIKQGVNTIIMGSETGNFNAELFMKSAPLRLFPYVEELRDRLHRPNERAVILQDNCAIHVTDELKIDVLQKNIQRTLGAIIKLTPESNDYNIIEAYGKETSLGTMQTAFKMAGIGHKVKASKLVASVMTDAFNKILNRVESDNVMASELRPPPK
ncbi:MAG: hypothetical protein EZS28_001474 [Streblomastix strix]|uniref:DDE-1 domain-containing protein n=1 Tax=Streblomastix strix TaxID=222440 RepID=A0A5J4X739_9EUKA|nr:MAG: hypothetical protein EZS28_001474 [Streblomastix strix]